MKVYEKDIVSVSEMKEIERLGDASGLPYYDMMENAGTAVFEFVSSYAEVHGLSKTCAIFCGKGNNDGDGLVIASLLANEGWEVSLALVEGEPATKDAITNRNILSENVKIVDASAEDSFGKEKFDFVIDALYGTGFHGSLRENGKLAIERMNKLGETAKVVAVDIPSGLPGNLEDSEIDRNPEILKQCVQADFTFSFHAKKPVHVCEKVKHQLGDVLACDIGLRDVLK